MPITRIGGAKVVLFIVPTKRQTKYYRYFSKIPCCFQKSAGAGLFPDKMERTKILLCIVLAESWSFLKIVFQQVFCSDGLIGGGTYLFISLSHFSSSPVHWRL